MKTILCASAALAAVCGFAGAAAAQEGSWEGWYAGAQVAYHSGEVDDRGCTGLCVPDYEVRETYVALQGGYDMPFGDDMIVGVMGWLGVTPVKDRVTLAPGVVIAAETDFAGFIGGRIGLDRGQWLPYAFAGYEHIEGTVVIAAAPTPRNDGSHSGLGLGVGAEYRASPKWSMDGRYMYSDLDEEAYNFGGGTTFAAEKSHTFSFGMNYRFGG